MYCHKTDFIAYFENGIQEGNIGVVNQKITDEDIEFRIQILGPKEWENTKVLLHLSNGRSEKRLGELIIRNGMAREQYKMSALEYQKGSYTKLIFVLGEHCYGMVYLNRLKEETEYTKPPKDKWESVKKNYPVLYPFKGQGPYIFISPKDLQLLPEKYHHLSSNSYLMHGFYQYRHMILGEYSWERGTFFYVGVPGEYVPKEQSSAAMFGFEGYERSGDLGYYLYRVEL